MNVCTDCKREISRAATRCQSCSQIHRHNSNGRKYPRYNYCVGCGKGISRSATRCRQCYWASKRKYPRHTYCVDCGIETSNASAQRCRRCATKKMWADGVLGTKEHLANIGAGMSRAWATGKMDHILTEQRAYKIGISTKQRWEDGEFDDPEVKVRQSAGVSAAWERGTYDKEWHLGQSERIRDAWARGDFDDRQSGIESPSGPESQLMEILDGWNIDYVFQFPIKHKRYDFFLPGHNLIIEYDSSYWHSEPEHVANDAYKDSLAILAGIELFRLKGLSNRDLTKKEMVTILMDKFPEIPGVDRNTTL